MLLKFPIILSGISFYFNYIRIILKIIPNKNYTSTINLCNLPLIYYII